jgi:hypothetical protein
LFKKFFLGWDPDQGVLVQQSKMKINREPQPCLPGSLEKKKGGKGAIFHKRKGGILFRPFFV